MAKVLMPLPHHDFDPTETGVPWRVLSGRGHEIVFATPAGRLAEADPRMLTGQGLGIFARFMQADRNGRSAHDEMIRSQEFRHPIAYEEIRPAGFDAMILSGVMRPACGLILNPRGYRLSWPTCSNATARWEPSVMAC